MNVWCMRHGQTNFNVSCLCNDNPDTDVHLTELGIQQAEVAAERLRDIPLERIVVSELRRTHQTARIINRYHDCEIEVHPAFNDIRSGFEGLPVADYFAATGDDRLHKRAHGGESLLDYKQRVLGFIGWLSSEPLADVLVVAHEETLRVFYVYFRQLTDDHLLDLHFDNAQILRFCL